MCGIAGVTRGGASDFVLPVLEILGCRGPDGKGYWFDERFSFGHTRLSIIDLEHGAQPMSDARGHRQITCNGEIYNYKELRAAMSRRSFRTDSDTEVILNLAAKGEAPERWVRKLDGMFAFALADNGELVLARDPLGVKPLYLGEIDGDLAFASELKALAGKATHIAEFPPGYVYHGRQGMRRYWRLNPPAEKITDAAEAIAGIRARLEYAVRSRLLADVPLGVFLSGGLDSSIIAALAVKYKNPLDTFAVGTHDSSDLQAARKVAGYLGTRHHERLFELREVIEMLPEVIYRLESFDCALVRSAIPNYFLAALASKHVKVALSGEGADELFAGYAYLKDLAPTVLEEELFDITRALHQTNLQRCDRMSMAHGLEVRVPFLDSLDMVEHASRIHSSLKLHGRDRTEKWILRKAAEDLLPGEIVWRPKMKFAAGSGLGDKLAVFAEANIGDDEFGRKRQIGEDLFLQSKEELMYYRLFRQFYPQDDLLPLVGRGRSV